MLAAELAATPLTLQEEIEADATFSAESTIDSAEKPPLFCGLTYSDDLF